MSCEKCADQVERGGVDSQSQEMSVGREGCAVLKAQGRRWKDQYT